MPAADMFEVAFRKLRHTFKQKTKRTFLKDIRGQIEDDEKVQKILLKRRTEHRYVAVTFDRKKNDGNFSYIYFDLLLVALDGISGGNGIYKPSNQMRALLWHGTRSDLLWVLRYFANHNVQVNFKRALVLPFPVPPVGHQIDASVHMR